MNGAHLTGERLGELIDRFPAARVAVVGDFFLDKYLECDPRLEERSVETGRAAHQVIRVRTSPGCAGVVTANLASLGVQTLYAVGIVGDDGEGYDLRNRLREVGCDTTHLQANPSRATPTYLKPRDAGDASLAGEHDRYDTKNHSDTPGEAADKLIESIDALLPRIDALMIMDQVEARNHGAVTDRVRQALCERARRHRDRVIFWADSRRRIREYRHVIIKPNEFEAIGRDYWAPGETVDAAELQTAVERLRESVEGPVVVTRGALGMIVTDPRWTIVPAVRVAGPLDPTGAGDSASAGTVAALCAGADLVEAAVVGNLVASLTIQQLAATGVARPDQLPERLALWQRQQAG